MLSLSIISIEADRLYLKLLNVLTIILEFMSVTVGRCYSSYKEVSIKSLSPGETFLHPATLS